MTDIKKRFFDKVSVSSEDDCWNWTGFRNRHGYGLFWMNGKSTYSHRAAYEISVGEIGEFDVLHKCDNPSCVNPKHLFLGTHLDNMMDREMKGRNNPPRGEKQGNSFLTERDVIEIKTKWKSGNYTQVEIAREYRTTASNISHIVMGKNWAHVLV